VTLPAFFLDEQNQRILPQIKALEQSYSAAVGGFQVLVDSLSSEDQRRNIKRT